MSGRGKCPETCITSMKSKNFFWEEARQPLPHLIPPCHLKWNPGSILFFNVLIFHYYFLQMQFVGPSRRRVWSTSTPLCRIDPFANSAVQTVNHRRSSVSGRSSTVLEQAVRQCHVSQFVVGFPAATEAHTVPTDIPKHYHVTFLNGNNHSGPSSKALLLSPPK